MSCAILLNMHFLNKPFYSVLSLCFAIIERGKTHETESRWQCKLFYKKNKQEPSVYNTKYMESRTDAIILSTCSCTGNPYGKV